MDKNMDFTNFQGYPGYSPYDISGEGYMNDMYKDPLLNPMIQYEQGYMYYRYLSQQMEYKIKSKEYEKLCNRDGRDRKIE